jgi:hypothetical protein
MPFDYNALAVTVFTGVLALVAWLQLRATRKQAEYMRDGLKVTERSANAAKESADAATKAVNTSLISERAVVLTDSITLNTSDLAYTSVVLFTLKNFGQTIADSVELTGKLCGGLGQWPLEKMPPATIAPQGTNTWITEYFGKWIGDEDTIKTINVGLSVLQFEIDVTYTDAFEKSHRYHCEGRYEPALKQFLITASTSE